ncbi:hypothetical protein GIB67_005416 [Kingdonia uniflora]|uniref:Histone-lysine N-methyltransferase SUVR5 n=1 Tax=Kingdonia uniflora TaxID=39325 RepID=A0A7J7NHR1_9MAGN|nr:hypothetical protein GIB67_005416 [Kingdonia uniflora]
MEVLSCSDVQYAGESNGSQRSSGPNILYNQELNGLEVSEIVPKGDDDAALNGEWPSKDISSVHQGRVYESPILDEEQNSFDSQQCSLDILKHNTETFVSSESLSPNADNDWDEGSHFLETEWSEQDTAVALWVKWRGKWQAGIRCAREDYPLSILKARPTHERKEYFVVYFPHTRNYSWADTRLVRPINEFPEPIAHRSHYRGLEKVKDLSLPHRFIMQKLAIGMVNISDQLHHETLIESARKVVAWKEFAMEVSQCNFFSDLGKMLLKLQRMILQHYVNPDWLQHSFDSWTQRCESAQSAESVEMLKEELVNSVMWSEVEVLRNALVQPDLGSEWKTWKQEALKWFSTSSPINSVRDVEPQNSDFPTSIDPNISRKRPKLEVRRAEIQYPANISEVDSGFFTERISAEGPIPSETWDGIVVDAKSSEFTGAMEVVKTPVDNQLPNPGDKYRQCAAFIESKGRQCVRWANDCDIYCCVHLSTHSLGTTVKLEETPYFDAPVCEGTTTHGTKCKHKSQYGSPFCKKHGLEETQNLMDIENPPSLLESTLKRSHSEMVSGSSKEIILSGSGEVANQLEFKYCIGPFTQENNEPCYDRPKLHTLYCEKHIPGFLKRARNGKSRIISKEYFADLLKNCNSHDQKLHLHQACILLYGYIKGALTRRNPLSKETQLQWILSEASKDFYVGEFLMKLISLESEKLKRFWDFNDKNDKPFCYGAEQSVVICSSNAPEPTSMASQASQKLEIRNNGVSVTNAGSNNKPRTLICKLCGLKFDLLPDLGRHHQAAHMGQNSNSNFSLKRAAHINAYKLKSGKLSRTGAASFRIRNRGNIRMKKGFQGSSLSRNGQIRLPTPVSEVSGLGKLAESQCSSVAKLLFSEIQKAKPRPSNRDILSVARSICCKISLQTKLEEEFGVLPERLYVRAAKLCSEHNVQVVWHQEGYVCPRGCKKTLSDSHILSPLVPLPNDSIKFTSEMSVDIVKDEDLEMDECHYIVESRHLNTEPLQQPIVLSEDVSFGKEPIHVPCVVDEDLLDSLDTVINEESSDKGNVCPMPWEGYTYITERLLDSSLGHDTESSQLACACPSSTCIPEACDHVYLFDNDNENAKDIYGEPMQGKFPYDKKGRIILEEGYFVYECNSICTCASTCHNRVLQNGVQIKLEIFKTENKGWSVRAREDISRGTFVCEYIGEVINVEEADDRAKSYNEESCSFLYKVENAHINDMCEGVVSYVIDATRYGNVSRFINHSCSPNLVIYQVLLESMDCRLAHIGFYASRDVSSSLLESYRHLRLLPEKNWLLTTNTRFFPETRNKFAFVELPTAEVNSSNPTN